MLMYEFSLKTTGITVGTLLICVHAIALFRRSDAIWWLRKFPRSRSWGIALLLIAALWTFLLVMKMDLGEFANLRIVILWSIAGATVLSWYFLEDFLAVRSTGIVAILAAKPILSACFLRSANYRFALVILAYIWILLGLTWVGMPYLMRDQIAWLVASPWRWNIAVGTGILVGLSILSCSLFPQVV